MFGKKNKVITVFNVNFMVYFKGTRVYTQQIFYVAGKDKNDCLDKLFESIEKLDGDNIHYEEIASADKSFDPKKDTHFVD